MFLFNDAGSCQGYILSVIDEKISVEPFMEWYRKGGKPN